MKHLSIKNRLSILVVFLSFSVSSCKKFLDQQPITTYGSDAVFSDVNSAKGALAGVYSRLTGDNGYGKVISLYYTMDNDETIGGGTTLSGTNGARYEIARYNPTITNTEIYNGWLQLFQGIDYANTCIDNIPKMAMYNNGTTQQQKQLRRMYGEVLTLRAQFYFEAIRNWGDLPEQFLPAYTAAPINPFPKRTNRDSLYDRILEDLKLASTLMPWRNEVVSIGDDVDERLTKGSAKALRARIALFRGGYSLRQVSKIMERSSDYKKYYQIARDECNEIMQSGQHNLNQNYKSLWKDIVCGHKYTDPDGELMFQATGIGVTNGTVANTKLGYYNGPKVSIQTSLNTVTTNGAILIIPTYFYQFDSTDLRKDVTVAPYTVGTDGITKTGVSVVSMYDGKYRRDWINNPAISTTSTQQWNNLSWQILRYSDVLLMFAEAENEINGATTAAYDAINMVRRRGFGKPINVSDPTVDLSPSSGNFFDAIVRERSLELGCEGIRKYDLIRWNLLESKLKQTQNWLSAMAGTEPLLPAGIGPYGGIITLPKKMYYRNNTTADDKTIYANSYYKASPSSTPAGTTSKSWFTTNGSGTFDIVDKMKNVVGNAFTHSKSELFPIPQKSLDANYNLTQNPGY